MGASSSLDVPLHAPGWHVTQDQDHAASLMIYISHLQKHLKHRVPRFPWDVSLGFQRLGMFLLALRLLRVRLNHLLNLRSI